MNDIVPPEGSENTATSPRRTMGRIAKWVLAISLVLNFLFVGAGIGLFFGSERSGATFGEGSGHIIRALPHDARHELARNMRRSLNRDLGLNRRQLSQSILQIAGILETEPFDANALQTVFTRQAAKLSEVQNVANRELVRQITQLTPEQRATMASRLRERMERKKSHIKM